MEVDDRKRLPTLGLREQLKRLELMKLKNLSGGSFRAKAQTPKEEDKPSRCL